MGAQLTDCVYHNGTIRTFDPRGSSYKVLAVKDGAIVYLGNENDAKDWIDKARNVIDLRGQTILPSFTDPHVHAPGLAYDILFNVNLYDVLSKEQTLQRIEAHVTANPDLPAYFGRGFNAGFFEGMEKVKGPRKEHLDAICNHKPIILSDFGGNYFWMNSCALRTYGITKATVAPARGTIELDNETGELWGVLREGARALVPYQSFSAEQNYKAAKWFTQVMNSYGYTSVMALRPPGTVEPRMTSFDMFKTLEAKGELHLRIQGARDMNEAEDIDAQLEEMQREKKSIDSALVQFSVAKFFLDGVIESATGYLLKPYTTAAGKGPDYRSTLLWDFNTLVYAFRRCMETGFQIHCHTIGDGAVRAALDALEVAFDQMGVQGDEIRLYRTTLAHLQLIDPTDMERMARLNVIAAVQPYWHFKSPTQWWTLEQPLIGDRAEHQYPLESLNRKGVTIASSSDYPVTPEPNPFFAIQAGVTRNIVDARFYGLADITDMEDPRFLLDPNERMTVESMVRSFTINGAYATLQEASTGSLEVGKSADFVVIDKDPLRVDPLELSKIKIISTVFQGRTVYSVFPKRINI